MLQKLQINIFCLKKKLTNSRLFLLRFVPPISFSLITSCNLCYNVDTFKYNCIFWHFSVSVVKTSHRKQIESIQLKVNAKIFNIEIEFATDKRPLSVVQLQGATAGLVLKSSYTQVDCAMAAISVEDLNPCSIHKEVNSPELELMISFLI